jgi:hypothetical protein
MRARATQFVQRRSYGLNGWGFEARFPAGDPLLHNVHTDPGTHLFSSQTGTGGCFLEGKAAGAWSWPLSSTWFRDYEWCSYTFTPQYVFMAFCSINEVHGCLYLYYIISSGKESRTYWIGGWLGIRTGLELWIRNRPALASDYTDCAISGRTAGAWSRPLTSN